MKLLVFVFVAVSALQSTSGDLAAVCDLSACTIESNCRCTTSPTPLEGSLDDWPQLIALTFDDAITDRNYNDYYSPLLLDLQNPDGNPIGGTFFVPHEYTNYKRVNDLYNNGFEIGVHSITKEPDQDYWRHASEETLVQEFQGQRQIISKFANIPLEKIIGVRTPQLQLSGNNSIKAFTTSGLTYDSSWPSLPSKRLFPYTLDYKSTEDCLLGAECPNEAFPGFWILPINDFTGDGGKECNVIAGCGVNGTSEEISKWLTEQVNAIRTTSKTPITLMLSASWLNTTEKNVEAFKQFSTEMSNLKDVFMVPLRQVLEWTKSPVKLDEFQTDSSNDDVANCDINECHLKKGTDDRNMNCCVSCPGVYPWLGNPNGDKQ